VIALGTPCLIIRAPGADWTLGHFCEIVAVQVPGPGSRELYRIKLSSGHMATATRNCLLPLVDDDPDQEQRIRDMRLKGWNE
jgi:hypothetical protein